MISLSPLPTAHPSCFQPTLVRASGRCYPTFTLAMGRSPRFASFPSDWQHRSLRSGKRPPTACRHTVSGTISLPSQGCFSPFPHGTGSLSVAGNVFSLGRWSSRFPAGFHVSRGTQEPDKGASLVSPTGLAPCIADHSRSFGYEIGFLLPGATAVTPCPVLQHPECNASRLMHTRGLG